MKVIAGWKFYPFNQNVMKCTFIWAPKIYFIDKCSLRWILSRIKSWIMHHFLWNGDLDVIGFYLWNCTLRCTFNSSTPDTKKANFGPNQSLTTGPYFKEILWNDLNTIESSDKTWWRFPINGKGEGPESTKLLLCTFRGKIKLSSKFLMNWESTHCLLRYLII